MIKKGFLIILSFVYLLSSAQNKQRISVYFLHGSKPYREYKRSEKKRIGGFYGGHVSIVIDSIEFGFTSDKKIRIFPNRKKLCGYFYKESFKKFQKDTVGQKYTIIRIPINDTQQVKLYSIIERYIEETPYCYAFLGMRCGSATYEILSQIGILDEKRNFCNIVSNFYPRLLRKKMTKFAKRNRYRIILHKGKKARIWEGD